MLRKDVERRFGEDFSERVLQMIRDSGLPADPGPVVSSTLAALQLTEAARDAGRADEVHERLFRAYWGDGLDIGDLDVLARVAADSGLDPDDALAAVRENRYRERVIESTAEAMEIGVSGVPAWLVDERLVVPGAQPHDVFERILARLGHAPVEP